MEIRLFWLILFFTCIWLIVAEFTSRQPISRFVLGLWGQELNPSHGATR